MNFDFDGAKDPEASLRVAPDGAVRGGRVMLERASADVPRRIAARLSLGWAPEAEALLAATEALGLPLIAGWDDGGAAPKYKLYANASDAAEATRAALQQRLGLASSLPLGEIVGLNVSGQGVETKIYVQRPKLRDLGLSTEIPEVIASIDAAAWVASYDVRGGDRALRAVFAATIYGREATAEYALASLTGAQWPALRARFPFAPGPLRQIGWSESGEVTVYAKRRGRAAPVHALAPLAIFRRGDCEVGLYVTPTATTPRAFTRTKKHALTFRTRQGSPGAEGLEALGAWAAREVAAAEDRGPIEASRLDAPPGDWSRSDG